MLQFLKRQTQRPQRRRVSLHNQAGVSLIEMIVAFIFVGILAIIMIPAYNRFYRSGQIGAAVSELHSLQTDIIAFNLSEGRFPNNLAETGTGILVDPFGNPYQYMRLDNLPPGTGRLDAVFNDLNEDFDVYSLGPDGLSQQLIDDPDSLDDIVRGNSGGFFGLAELF